MKEGKVKEKKTDILDLRVTGKINRIFEKKYRCVFETENS